MAEEEAQELIWTAALLSCCSVLQAFSKTTSRVSRPLNDDDNVQKKTLFRRKTQKTLGVTSSLNSTFTFWPKCRFYLHCYAPILLLGNNIFSMRNTHRRPRKHAETSSALTCRQIRATVKKILITIGLFLSNNPTEIWLPSQPRPRRWQPGSSQLVFTSIVNSTESSSPLVLWLSVLLTFLRKKKSSLPWFKFTVLFAGLNCTFVYIMPFCTNESQLCLFPGYELAWWDQISFKKQGKDKWSV